MKKFFLCLSVLGMVLTGCSKDENKSNNGNEEIRPGYESETIPVSIGFSGEILNVVESPLTRSTSSKKDWYYFQVYSKPEGNTNVSYTKYAYGFFDNKENMVINLKEGYKYKFVAGMCVSAEGKVYKFSLVNSGWGGVGNSFFISSTESVRYMYEGYLYLQIPYAAFDRPDIDRFFGETVDYSPAEGGSVQINMKRVSFGAKFVAKDFNEGSLEIDIEGSPKTTIKAADGNEVEKIISFNLINNAYLNDDYIEVIPVNIVWVKTDGARVPIANEKVSFKRNKLMTINFEVKESSTGNSFSINTNETMEEGENISIGGDGTNTGVNPSN